MNFETILEEVNGSGRFQFLYLLLCLFSVRHTFMIFPQYGEMDVPVYCPRVQLERLNWTIAQQIEYTSPNGKHGCSYYNFTFEVSNWSNVLHAILISFSKSTEQYWPQSYGKFYGVPGLFVEVLLGEVQFVEWTFGRRIFG